MREIVKRQTRHILFGWLIQAKSIKTVIHNNKPSDPEKQEEWEKEIREDARTILVLSTFRQDDLAYLRERIALVYSLNGNRSRRISEDVATGAARI